MGARYLGKMVFLWWGPPAAPMERQQEFPFQLTSAPRPQHPLSLSDAILLFLKSKEKSGFDDRYIITLKQLLNRFQKDIPAKTVKDSVFSFEQWMLRQHWQNTSLASNLGRMSSFFRFAVNRQWIEKNPCDSFEKPRIHRGTPQILTLAQSEQVMRWTMGHKPSMLAYLALALFSGVRPEELEVLPWGAVDLRALHVIVSAEASKVSRRRICPIPPNAAKWLAVAQKTGAHLPVSQSSRKRFLKELREPLGFKHWPQDVLRHTAASYMLAKVQDAGKVALWLGNSPKILMTHYAQLVESRDARSFWKINP